MICSHVSIIYLLTFGIFITIWFKIGILYRNLEDFRASFKLKWLWLGDYAYHAKNTFGHDFCKYKKYVFWTTIKKKNKKKNMIFAFVDNIYIDNKTSFRLEV